jgi:hypothetical protein
MRGRFDGWLGNRGVSDMAGLTMLIVTGPGTPVSGCMQGQSAHRQDERHGQNTAEESSPTAIYNSHMF